MKIYATLWGLNADAPQVSASALVGTFRMPPNW